MKEERKPEQEWEAAGTKAPAENPPEVSPAAAQEAKKETEEKKPSEKKHKNSVVVYIAVLFAVAFLLLLLAYFMQQRNTAQMLEGLRDSNSAMENIEMLQQRNIELDKQVDDLTAQLRAYEDRLETADAQEKALADAQKQNQALDVFWQLVKAYESGEKNTCRSLIAQMEEKDFVAVLPSEGEKSAAAEFETIRKAVMK